MTQPASKNPEPSKMNKLLNGKEDQSIHSRLPRAAGAPPRPITSTPPAPSTPVQVSTPSKAQAQPRQSYSGSKFWPVFWTIASVISLLVNICTFIALLFVINFLGGTKATLSLVQNQATGLLGGLYNNFVKMDAASIKTTI